MLWGRLTMVCGCAALLLYDVIVVCVRRVCVRDKRKSNLHLFVDILSCGIQAVKATTMNAAAAAAAACK